MDFKLAFFTLVGNFLNQHMCLKSAHKRAETTANVERGLKNFGMICDRVFSLLRATGIFSEMS